MKNKNIIIGICGGTCSGKTTIATKLHKSLNDRAVYISQDSYYKDQSHLTAEEIQAHNFDHPESLELSLLQQHVQQLKNNKKIQMPTYCFKSHSRKDDFQIIDPATIIIVEGILIFSDEKLKQSFDVRIFVDIESDIRLIRRIKRDVLERGRDLNSIIEQYLLTVKPMHDEFVESQKIESDLVINSGSLEDQYALLERYLSMREVL